MLHSVFNLLVQAFILALKDTVTTTVAIGCGLSLFVLKQILIWRSKGLGAMKEHRTKDAGYGALLTAGVWICFLSTFVLKNVYEDRQSTLMRAHAAEVARDTYKQVVSDRDATIEKMEKEAKDSCRSHTSDSGTGTYIKKSKPGSSGLEQ